VRAGLEALPLDLVGGEAQQVADVLLVVARDRRGDLLVAAGGERALAARVREDALLADGARGLGGAGAGDRLGRGLGRLGVALGHRVVLGEVAQVAVRVDVAVDVAQLDEVAEPVVVALAHDLAVVGGDRQRLLGGEDVDAAAVLALGGRRSAGGDGRSLALGGRLLGEVVGVAGLAGDREAALGQARERADEIGGQTADQAGAHQDESTYQSAWL
jgi:hypothetical protein